MKLATHLIILAVFIATLLALDHLNPPLTEALTLKSETLEHLPPHEHLPGDSLMSHTHHHTLTSKIIRPDRDLLVTRAEFVLHNAPPNTLHHANLSNLSDRLWYCPEYTKPLFSIGEDQMHHPVLELPRGYAQIIRAGTPLMLQTMLHNPLPPLGYGDDYYQVSAEIRLYENKRTTNLKGVELIRLDLIDDPCGDTFTVPANTPLFRKGDPTETYPSPATHRFVRPGKLVYLGGHLHGWEGGESLDVYLNGELLKSFTTTKAKNDPYRHDTEHGPVNVTVKPGDVMTITATYKNDRPVPLTGAMGMVGAYFAPDY